MNELITQRLKQYNIQNSNDELNALKEVAQEIILFGFSQTDFFKHAFFCGGTCLRIVHGLQRFSEDLDFTTTEINPSFNFDHYMEDVLKTLKDFGLEMKVNKSKDDSFVKARALKEDSDKWKISFPANGKLKKIMIKLEIDTNPAAGAIGVMENLEFPLLHRIRCGEVETLFAGKIHALLCRSYTKGRDWYDFLWYVRNKSKINFEFLQNALFQMGPYKDKKINMSSEFVKKELAVKIASQDWEQIKKDVARFLRPIELPSLEIWNEKLFLAALERIKF